jgi:hypothetical protein
MEQKPSGERRKDGSLKHRPATTITTASAFISSKVALVYTKLSSPLLSCREEHEPQGDVAHPLAELGVTLGFPVCSEV